MVPRLFASSATSGLCQHELRVLPGNIASERLAESPARAVSGVLIEELRRRKHPQRRPGWALTLGQNLARLLHAVHRRRDPAPGPRGRRQHRHRLRRRRNLPRPMSDLGCHRRHRVGQDQDQPDRHSRLQHVHPRSRDDSARGRSRPGRGRRGQRRRGRHRAHLALLPTNSPCRASSSAPAWTASAPTSPG